MWNDEPIPESGAKPTGWSLSPCRRHTGRRPRRYTAQTTLLQARQALEQGRPLPGRGNVQIVSLGSGPSLDGWPGDLPVDPDPNDPGRQTDTLPFVGHQGRLAVNLVSFKMEPAFNNIGAMLDDTVALGAGVVRQPGLVQLFLSHVFGASGPGARLSTPAIEPADFVLGRLYGRIVSSDSFRYLEEVVRKLARRNAKQKVLVTFIEFGGGSHQPWGTSGLPSAPSNEGHFEPIFVRWSNENVGRSIWDDVEGTTVRFRTSGASSDWDLLTMDPNNAYKRVFYRRLSAALGKAIEDLARRLDIEGIDLSDYLEGIEIGNEMEMLHTVENKGTLDVDAEGWASWFYYCATALRAQCDWVPIWLPALASYAEEADGVPRAKQWEGKVEFLTNALAAIETRCSASDGEFRLDDLVDGIDYHFYHHTGGTDDREDRALPLLFLRAEVQLLSEILHAQVPNATLSVCESGVNTLCTGREGEDDGCEVPSPGFTADTSASWRPPTAADPTRSVDPLLFQASSVIMRPLIALASGAGLAGWHCHVGNADNFAAMGLHYDLVALPRVRTAQLRHRPSWWSFQRLGQIVGGARRVRVLAPSITDRGLIVEQTDAGRLESADLVWVIELRDVPWPDDDAPSTGGGGGWFAYMIFLDPGGPKTAPPRSATVVLRSTSHSHAYVLPTVPEGVRFPPSYDGRDVRHFERFPTPSWDVALHQNLRATPRSGAWQFTVSPKQGLAPLLVYSPSALTLDRVDTSSSG